MRVGLRLLRRARRGDPAPSSRATTDASRSYVRFEPLGAVLAVMPWNFPFWQVFRFAAPALMAGNAGVLKHASNVPRCALAIEEVFRDAGFPRGCSPRCWSAPRRCRGLIADPRIVAVTLTGSERAGRAVAERAGRELKKTVLELGGSDPFIVLADADVAAAARTAADARLINSGQSCIAAKRFIVVEAVADAVPGAVRRRAAQRAGWAIRCRATTQVGPLARDDLRDDLHRQVRGVGRARRPAAARRRGPAGPGAFYPPTVLAGVDRACRPSTRRRSGPSRPSSGAKDEADAVRLANDSVFGLGAALWTRTAPGPSGWPRRSRPGASSSTGW